MGSCHRRFGFSSGGIFNFLIVRFGCLLKTKYLSYVTTPFIGMIHVLWQFDLFLCSISVLLIWVILHAGRYYVTLYQ